MFTLPKILDNNRKTLLDTFCTIAPKYTTLSIATGYWDLEGTAAVIDTISDYTSIRLLIGQAPLIKRYAVQL